MISVPELKAFLNVTSDTLDYKRLRETVIQYIEQYCNRRLDEFTDAVDTYITTVPKNFLYLKPLNVTAITLVECWGRSEGPDNAIAFTDYWLEDERSRLGTNNGECFPYFTRITYTGGYSVDTCPDKLREAVLMQANFMVQRNQKEGGKLIARNEAFEAGSVWYHNPGMHQQVKELLQGYKKATIR